MRDGNWLGEQKAILHLKGEMKGPRAGDDVLVARRKLFYHVQDGRVPWRASKKNGRELKASRVFGAEDWFSGPYEESGFYRGNLADWGVLSQCGEWSGLEFGWKELRACSRGEQGGAATVAEPPPPAPKGQGGAKERFPWDDYWGELVCMVHEGEIARGDAETAQRLEARLQSKGHTKLPSSEYLEARVRRVLVSFRAKGYAPA